MSDIRTEIRDAFEREQSAYPPAAAMRAQVMASVSARARASAARRQPVARNLTWLMGATAVLLAIAIVAGLMAVRLMNSHPIPVVPASPGVKTRLAGPFEFLSMMSATSGWADIHQDGHPSHTTDGGAHWTNVSPPSVFAGGTSRPYFLDANRAWVGEASWGSGVQIVSFRTLDGGLTWQAGARITLDVGQVASAGDTVPGGLTLYFIDSGHGWLFLDAILQSQPGGYVAHRDALYITSDGGFHWRLVSTNSWSFTPAPFTSGCPWGAPVFISLTTGFMNSPDRTYEAGKTSNCAVPDSTSLHVTHDGGATWQFQPLPAEFGTSPGPVLPDFVDQLHGFLRLETQRGPTLIATSDGGTTWEMRSLPPVFAPDQAEIMWVDARNGWATSLNPTEPPLYRTRDGGATWTTVQTNLLVQAPDGTIGGLGFDFVDQDTGFAFERTETGGYTLVLKTTDGGHTWTAVKRFN